MRPCEACRVGGKKRLDWGRHCQHLLEPGNFDVASTKCRAGHVEHYLPITVMAHCRDCNTVEFELGKTIPRRRKSL